MADGNFDLSAVMRFDGKAAVAGAGEVVSSLKEVAAANKEVAASAREAAGAGGTGKSGAQPDGSTAKREAQGQKEAASATKEKTQADKEAATATKALADEEAKLERELQRIRDTLDPAAAAQRKLNAELDIAATGFAKGKLSASEYDATVKRLTGSTKQSGDAAKDAAAALNRNAFGARNLGQQVGDFATQVSLGGGFVRAFSSQAGQAGFAMSEMGGKIGAVGRFLVGPWGVALTVASLVLAPFIEKLFEGGKAADEQAEKLAKAATAADSYGAAQSLLGKVIDLTTGKLKTQNSVLIETIKLQAQANILKAQADQKKAGEALLGFAKPTASEAGLGALKAVGGVALGLTSAKGAASDLDGLTSRLAPLKAAVADYVSLTSIANASQDSLSKGLDATLRRIDGLARSGKLAGRDAIDAKAAVLALGTSVNDQRANKMVVDAIDGKGIADDLRPTVNDPRSPKAKKAKAPKSTEARDEFGRDAADKIAALKDQLSDTPSVVASVNKQLAQLDDLIDDIGRKKPPGFEKLIADAKELRPLVEAGLNKPYREYLRQQTEALDVQRLVTAGKVDEAAALKVVQGLQREIGPLTLEQRDAVLATVQAMRVEQREADILRDKQQAYLNALGSIKSAVRGVIFDGVGGLEALPGRLIKAFSTLKGEQLFDKLFDGAFRDLEDQAKGTTVVRDASDRMAAAVEKARTSTSNLGAAFDGLTAKVNTAAAPGAAGGSAATFLGSDGKVDVKALGAALAGMKSAPDPLAPADAGGESVVFGKKTSKSKSPSDFFGGAIERLTRSVGIGSSQKDRDTQIADSLKSGIQIKDDAAAKIGKFSGKAISGAATGAFANSIFAPLAKGLGIKTSATGAKIGGALGGLTGLPGGDIIGGILGSVVGGLFKKNNKYGSSTLAISDGRATAGTAIGKGASERQQADALGGSLADGLNSIASALGASLGSANVSIGYRPGHKAGAYRVDTTGQGRVTGVEAFEDEKDAIAFALRDAILDGAVTGLSAAMQRALSSNADIDRAVSEALGVKNLETLLGGLTGSLKAVFSAEDAAGKERVRLAKAYGLDINAVEKLNGEQRAKLIDDTLKARIGSLTTLSDSLKYGDLAEGSAADKLAALQTAIDAAQKAADAGTDGAADTLANLLSQKVSTTRDAYGTAGPDFTTARDSSISAIDRVIKMETDRVNAAAGVSAAQTASLERVATLADEANNIAAQQLAALQTIAGNLGGAQGYENDYSPNLGSVSRGRFYLV